VRQLQPAKDEDDKRRSPDACAVGYSAPRRHAEFPVNYRQEGHQGNAEGISKPQ